MREGLLFNLRVIAGYIIQLSAALLLAITFFFFWLMSLFLTTTGTGDAAREGAAPPELPKGGSGNPLLDLILQLLVLALAVYIAIRMAPGLMKKMKHIVSALLKFLAQKLKFMSLKFGDQALPHDFIDETEFIAPEKGKRGARILSGLGFFRKSPKSDNPAARIRFIYASLLGLLSGTGVVIRKADTAREIIRKADGMSDVREELDNLTTIYEKVRYGETVPEVNEVNIFEKGFQNLKVLLQKVKGPRNG